MIEVFKAKIIEDDDEREAAMAVIIEREVYYKTLFENASEAPRITVRYEGVRPLTIKIKFSPAFGRTIVIETYGYDAPSAVTKHAFKKLRRVAKNYFVKTKKRHRE